MNLFSGSNAAFHILIWERDFPYQHMVDPLFFVVANICKNCLQGLRRIEKQNFTKITELFFVES